MSSVATKPRAAYIHVPFCAHRCGYCNFTLIANRHDLIDRYLLALEHELSWLGAPQDIETLFIGGGTPTYLPPAALERLMRIVRARFRLVAGYELTVEANPGGLDDRRVAILEDYGATRLSLGAQSFHAAKLSMLERDHSAAEIEASVALG